MRVLLLLLPGLGDALCASPLFDPLVSHAEAVDVFTMLEPVAEYARALDIFHRVFFSPLLLGRRYAFSAIRELREQSYDLAVLPFPAARWQYHAFLLACGARNLLVHDYGGPISLLHRLHPHRLTVPLAGGHRTAENARLLTALALPQPTRLTYRTPRSWRSESHHEKQIIGINTGSMNYKGNQAKRWPIASFLQMADEQLARGRTLRFFIGPNETNDAELFMTHFGEDARVEIVQAALDDAARSLSDCTAFVGNDAGLTQLAAALGVPTVALFGMTSAVRGHPLGTTVVIDAQTPCAPCHDEGSPDFRCPQRLDYRCIREDIAVSTVNAGIEDALHGRNLTHPTWDGSFRLFGKVHTTEGR